MSVQGQFVVSTPTAGRERVSECVSAAGRVRLQQPDRLWLIKPPSDAGGQDNNYISGNTR